MPTHRAATYPGEKPSAKTVASVEVDPLDPTTSDPVDASGGGYAGASGAGSSADVFEVTNLLIPSGTDWSSGVGHQIGTLADGLHYSKLNLFELFIELADIPADDILLDVLDDPDYAAYSIGAYLTVEAGGTLGNSNNAVTGLSVMSTVEQGPAVGHVGAAWRGALNGFTGQPLHIGLHTNGITTADITVVRARATFLVI